MRGTEPSLDVLIIGAGPTGLTAAAEAKRLGLKVRIVDKKKERSTHDSRALVVHPRVLELLHAMNNGRVCSAIVGSGYMLENMNIYVEGSKTAISRPHVGRRALWGDAVYPFVTCLPQYRTEEVLEQELETMGGRVEWDRSLKSLIQSEETVESTVISTDGSEERVVSRYVVGCDGGKSKTRDLVGIKMHREKSEIHVIVADIEFAKTSWPFGEAMEPRLFLHSDGPTIFFPLNEGFRGRVFMFCQEDVRKEGDIPLNKEFFESSMRHRTGFSLDCAVADWATVFEITHGTSSKYREGRVFLAGDASHVHSPVGGQGMGYGISDAVNLTWKLAWAERCRKRIEDIETASRVVRPILDSYNDERLELGRRLIGFVEPATNFVTSRNFFLVKLRNLFARFVLPLLVPRNVRTLGQLSLRYSPSRSPIICDCPAYGFICESGDRLPNLHLANGDRLYEKIDTEHHTWVVLNANVHVNTDASNEGPGGLKAVHTAASSLQEGPPYIPESVVRATQAILVRPDLYVAAIGATVDTVWAMMCKLLGEDALSTM